MIQEYFVPVAMQKSLKIIQHSDNFSSLNLHSCNSNYNLQMIQAYLFSDTCNKLIHIHIRPMLI